MTNVFTAEAKVSYSENFRKSGKINFILATVLKSKKKKKEGGKKKEKRKTLLHSNGCVLFNLSNRY